MLKGTICGGRSQLDWCYEPALKYDLDVRRHPVCRSREGSTQSSLCFVGHPPDRHA